MDKINNITPEKKESIRRSSAYSLPNNPSDRGWSAEDIRKVFYKPIIDAVNSAVAEIDRVVDEANGIFGSIDGIVTDAKTSVDASRAEMAELREKMPLLGINDISFVGQDTDGSNVYLVSYNNGNIDYFTAPRGPIGETGPQGPRGVGISNVRALGQDAAGGNVYRLIFSNGGYLDFTAPKGDTGKGFSIAKTYASVDEMNADYSNEDIELYSFVLIDTGNVEDADNAKLYYKGTSSYEFLTDLSGSQGIQGETGNGISSVEHMETTTDGNNVYRIYFTNGSTFDFTAPKGNDGQDGENGEDGADGERGSRILKITSLPSSYSTTTDGFSPSYRIYLSTVLTQSGASDVKIGDVLWCSYYHYPVGYVDSTYVYTGTRVSIRGATGATGSAGADGEDGYTPVKGDDYFTDADIADFLNKVYPIGAIYISMKPTSPASLFGGSWTQKSGRFLIGATNLYTDGSLPYFNGNSSGGSESHFHTLNSGYAKYCVDLYDEATTRWGYASLKSVSPNYVPTHYIQTGDEYTDFTSGWGITKGIELGGSTDSGSNLPPYLAVYMWERIS